MNGVDCIRMNLEMGSMTIGLIDDMKDDCLRMPTAKGGNHPLWVLGHLTYSEASMVSDMMLGEGNPLEAWKPIFGDGSEPVSDASKYPPFDEVRAKYDQVRAATMKRLEKMTDADLDKPSANCPDEWKQYFGTCGQILSILGVHTFMHHGQVADARRSAGRAPNM
ncbi:MAG: DinB family protein [Phycisphaeraceae bacterium]|nr:DinB family protein [Phycisphaeraceae bacterium]MCB9847971.1 DinB family protein [Phycisphaeraceae bacterium]